MILDGKPVIAFDTETTGKYPVEAEICEVAAVFFDENKQQVTYQSLLKPSKKMSDFVISIHNITNEMVQDAPVMADEVANMSKFLFQGHLVAHHAAFDLGFLNVDFEKHGISTPDQYVFCSSVLARAAFPGKPKGGYKLGTLISDLGLEMGTAHRAVADSVACLKVFEKCVEVLEASSAEQLFKIQCEQVSKENANYGNDVADNKMQWNRFSLKALKAQPAYFAIVEAIQSGLPVSIRYGSKESKIRQIYPTGLVRSLGGDYIVAEDKAHKSEHPKKFYLKKITFSELS